MGSVFEVFLCILALKSRIAGRTGSFFTIFISGGFSF